MGLKLSPDDMRLYRFVDEIMFYKWDPIGVSDIDSGVSRWPRDEYRSYLPDVFQMVLNEKSAEEISHYLSKVRTEYFGLNAHPARDLEIGNFLLAAKSSVMEQIG